MQNALKKFEEWGIRRRSERNRRNAERRRRLASTLGIEDADAALDLSTLQMGEMVGQGGFSIVSWPMAMIRSALSIASWT